MRAEKYGSYGPRGDPVQCIGSHTLAVVPPLGWKDVSIELYDLDEVRRHSASGPNLARQAFFAGDRSADRLKPTRIVKLPERRKEAYEHLRPGCKRQQWSIRAVPISLSTCGKLVIALEDEILLDPEHWDEENDPQAPEQRAHSVHTYTSLDIDTLRRLPEPSRTPGSRLNKGGKVQDAWHLRCYDASLEIIGQNPPVGEDRVCVVGDLLLAGLSATAKGEVLVRVLDYGAEARAVREG